MRAGRPHDDHGIEQIVYYDKGGGTANLVDRIVKQGLAPVFYCLCHS